LLTSILAASLHPIAPLQNPAKVIMRKHDPVVNQHVIFQEAKLK